MALITKRIIDLAPRGHTLPLGPGSYLVTVVGLQSRRGKVVKTEEVIRYLRYCRYVLVMFDCIASLERTLHCRKLRIAQVNFVDYLHRYLSCRFPARAEKDAGRRWMQGSSTTIEI